jgi:hypothetical protein
MEGRNRWQKLRGRKTEALAAECSAWLDLWGGKALYYTSNNSIRLALRPVEDSGFNLTEVADYPGAMPVLVEALKEKGVRFEELSFDDDEIIYLNQNVVVLRGRGFGGRPPRVSWRRRLLRRKEGVAAKAGLRGFRERFGRARAPCHSCLGKGRQDGS